MKTYITEYKLGEPFAPIENLEGYGYVQVLVRRERQPLGLFFFPLPSIQPRLDQTGLEYALAQQLGSLPLIPPVALPQIPRPPISVIVCTRDRAEIVGRCLASLKRLNYPEYEVIVVDNAPKDDRVRQTVADTGFRYVREDRPGLSWARNCGIAAARYDLIAFTDDDLWVDADWLLGLADGFADPQVMGVTGLVLPGEIESESQQRFEHLGGFSKGLYPRVFKGDKLTSYDLITTYSVGAGANMAFRRCVFEQLGDFDTALGAGTLGHAMEDLDIWHRALMQGMILRYEPSALAWHYHRSNMRNLRKQLYNYGCGFGVYLIKLGLAGELPRRAILRMAFYDWIWNWFIRRMFQPYHPQDTIRFPKTLMAIELLGVLRAPWDYRATYRTDRRIRQANPQVSKYDLLKKRAAPVADEVQLTEPEPPKVLA